MCLHVGSPFPPPNQCGSLPAAISHGYAKCANEAMWRAEGLPGTMLDYLRSGWDVLLPSHACASAGQVMQESGSLSTARTNITERDRNTSFVVADSGRFSDPQGTLGPWRYTHTVLQSLRWQEDHGDYVMALDFPTGGIATGKMAAQVHRLIHVDGENLEAMSPSQRFERGIQWMPTADVHQHRYHVEPSPARARISRGAAGDE